MLCTPLFGALKRLYPDAEIWFMGTPLGIELVRRDPYLAGVIPFDKRGNETGLFGSRAIIKKLKEQQFDLVYSLHKSWRSGLILRSSGIPRRVGFTDAKLSFLYTELVPRVHGSHEVLRCLSILESEFSGEMLSEWNILRNGGQSAPLGELRLFSATPSEVSDEVGDVIKGAPYVVIAPGSVWRTKRWHETGFRHIAQSLLARGKRVVLIGSTAEREIAERVQGDLALINLAGRTNIGEFLAVVERAEAVVCNDSLALHVASAFKRPVTAIFCATSPSYGFGPWNTKSEVVGRDELFCRPCTRHGGERCPMGTDACIIGVSENEVLSALERVA